MALWDGRNRLTTAVSLAMWFVTCAPMAHAVAKSNTWQGTVTHVSDGDTLWVRPSSGDAYKIRLDGIDAPEICQTYGVVSRDILASRLMGQRVHVKVRRLDTYGRSLAHVALDGQDMGAWMVQQGAAWSYRYRRDPGPYAHQESQARSQRLGVFADAQSERPRDFRLRHGSCH
jgi:endonuclease YncB( thermonuclease family)